MTVTTAFDRMGDFILILPAVSGLFKATNEKTHFVFTQHFPLFKKLENVLRHQPFTSNVSYVDLPLGHAKHEPEWRHYDPKQFGIDEGRNINLGFFSWPPEDKYIGRFYAEQYGLPFDDKILLECPPVNYVPEYEHVWIETEPYRKTYKTLHRIIPPDAVELKHSDPMEYNIAVALKAKNLWTNGGGFPVFLELFGKVGTIMYKSALEVNEGDRRGFMDMGKNKYILM
jgi:hypothetical protein